jgi:hypothetical protein
VLLLNYGCDGKITVFEMGGSLGRWKVGMYGGRKKIKRFGREILR